ncbi:MAG: sigma 54-interacting transcriptional regulator [Acidobacteriota bacterium]
MSSESLNPPPPALPSSYVPEFDSLKNLLLDLAARRCPDEATHCLVRGLSSRPHVALARVWLLQSEDGSSRPDSPDGEEISRIQPLVQLHLAASSGFAHGGGQHWNEELGAWRRVPLEHPVLGPVVVEAEEAQIQRLDDASESPFPVERALELADDDRSGALVLAQREGIQGFGVVPVAQAERVIGALAVWLRVPAQEEGMVWLRLLADHLAAAVVNTRAFKSLERALEENRTLRERLEAENTFLKEEITSAGRFGEILGDSPPMRAVGRQIETVAATEATVMVLGETGTGKELVAREIHRRSSRREGPLIKVNCAAIPRELFESEFFGHVRGAFTGATRDRVGRFEAADGGTLFLDEVGEIPLEQQGKLLRLLQESSFERVGETRTRHADVRLVVATHRDLKTEVEARRFREDLYYRLAVFPLEVAPLRQRGEDILLLARHFITAAAKDHERPMPPLSDEALAPLLHYPWPGNVRELRNVVERAVILWRGGPLRFDSLGGALQAPESASLLEGSAGPSSAEEAIFPPPIAGAGAPSPEHIETIPARGYWTEDELQRLQRDNLLRLLEHSGGRVFGADGAAARLGVPPTTLTSRLKKLGLKN